MKATQVTPETYIRAESERQFGVIAKMAGGVNRFYHFRRPTPLDKQNVVRMNRDTLYSMGIVDTSQGATITVPELPRDRYVSVYLVDNDHYCPFVIYTSGTHALPGDTPYLCLAVRIQVFNPKDEDEVALINKLQDQFVIEANRPIPCRSSRGTWSLCRPSRTNIKRMELRDAGLPPGQIGVGGGLQTSRGQAREVNRSSGENHGAGKVFCGRGFQPRSSRLESRSHRK